MTDEPARFRCFRCRVNYRIEEPQPRAERRRCPECRLAFWSLPIRNSRCAVGIYPTELAG